MSEFTDFFAGPWQLLLGAVQIPGMPNASWDRKAAYLYLNKGTEDMTKGTGSGRGRKPAVNDSAKKIADALSFTKIATKSSGEGFERMAFLTSGWVFTHDGIVACGAPLGENDLAGYVDHDLLSKAIANVGKELSITSNDAGIEIASGDYEVLVPNGDTATMRPGPADQGTQWPLGDEFRTALEIAGRVVKDTADTVRDASIYSLGQSLLATNGLAVVEAWHGQQVPPGCVFPRAFANALNKTDKKLAGFSFDQTGYRSFTVWFDDGSFMRTSLYAYSDYPQSVVTQYAAMFAGIESAIETPKGFFEAVKIVSPFGEHDGEIAITGGAVVTDYREGEGFKSGIAVKGLPEGIWISGDKIMPFADAAKVWFGDASSNPPLMLFVGQTWRAAVAGKVRAIPAATAPQIAPPPGASLPDPTSAPAWSAPPAANAAPAPAAAPPAAAPAPQAITLPYTPIERHTSMRGAPGWDTTPYTLQPGETMAMFVNPADNEARAKWGWPPNPTPADSGAPTFAAPVQSSASPAPVQTPPETATFHSEPGEATAGFTPFQPGPAGAPTFAAPAPDTVQPATETAPATASPSSVPPWAVPTT